MDLKKLAFYFDTDDNGVVKGDELKRLKIWIDIDGDAVTDKGELVPLSDHGITEIVIPGHHKLVPPPRSKIGRMVLRSRVPTQSRWVKIVGRSWMDCQQIIGSDASHMIDKGTSGTFESSLRLVHESISTTRKPTSMPTLDTLHQAVIEQVAAGKYEALATGKLPRVGSQIDMQIQDSQSWASELLKTALYQSGTKANFDVMRITLLEGWRPEELEYISEGAAVNAFLQNEDIQTAVRSENKPPKVDTVNFSTTSPTIGSKLNATITGSDPENMDH